MNADRSALPHRVGRVAMALLLGGAPALGFAQAASPFMTGATALQTNILARGKKSAAGAVKEERRRERENQRETPERDARERDDDLAL